MTDVLLNQMKDVIMSFLSELRTSIFYNNVEAIAELKLAETAFEAISKYTLMEHVIQRVLPHKESLVMRNTQFFYDNRDFLFKGLDARRINFYADYFMNRVDPETLGTIWIYFDTIVKIAEVYKKKK